MKTKILALSAILILISYVLCPLAANAEGQKREARNVWLATVYNIDWPSRSGTSASVVAQQKADLLSYIENFHSINMNGISLQVRSMCDAMYNSAYEPWSSYLTGSRGTNPGWDPLAYAVDECHKRGMECHAWVNPFRFSTGSNWTTAQDVTLKNSGWLLSYTSGSTTTTILNPGIAEARQRIVDVCKDMITKYDIDGIIFDDYFYPSGIPTSSAAPDYDLWKNSGTSLSFANWRRANINLTVKMVYDMIQTTKPYVKFSIGPAGVAGTAATSASVHNVDPCPTGSDWQYNGIFSDPLAWLEEGTIDYIAPQLYWKTTHSTNPFGPLTQWWSYAANHFGRHHYASHSISFLSSSNTESDWAEVAKQISYSREYNKDNAPGEVFYSAKYLCGPSVTGLGDYLHEHLYTTQALTPALTWKDKTNYDAPTSLTYSGGALKWTGINKSLIKYSVYAVPTSVSVSAAQSATFGGIKSDYLLGVTYTPTFAVPTDRQAGYWYAVCIVDGFGNEFAPAYYNAPGSAAAKVTLSSPIGGVVTTWNQVFAWSAASNATYRLQISDKTDFSNLVIDKSGISTNTATVDLTSLASSTTYYWRIVTSQPSCIDTPSDAADFITPVREKAPVTTLISPENGSDFTGSSITFSCTSVGADVYTLQIAKSNTFDAITASSANFTGASGKMTMDFPSDILPNGTFYWRVVTSKTNMDDNVSGVRNFTISGHTIGTYEQGYTVKKDKASYSPTGEVMITNNWMRSVLDDYSNFTQESNGLFNRSFCVKDGYVYVSGRADNSTAGPTYLRKYDASTGEHINDIILGAGTLVNYLPCNDVLKDSKGNILVANMVLKANVDPIELNSVNLETGAVTLVASCKAPSTLAKYRVDHVSVLGDVTSGNFYVFAAVASDNEVIRWTFQGGTQTAVDVCTLQNLYPTSATSTGVAPRVIPIDADHFFINGGAIYLSRYKFSTGALEGSFADNTALTPVGVDSNGSCIFTHNSKQYVVYPFSDNKNAAGFTFTIAAANDNLDFSSFKNCWTIPANGIGAVYSTTWDALAAAEVVSDTKTNVYIYVPGNGLASYTIDKYSGVESVNGDRTICTVAGTTVIFNRQVTAAKVLDAQGRLIATAAKTSKIELNAAPGIYLVTATADGMNFTQKVIIR